MVSDYKPILVKTPEEFAEVEIYFASDIHYGSELHDKRKWERFKDAVLDRPNRYVIMAGDYCEVALKGSKSDIYSQTCSIDAQRIWLTQQMYDLRERILCILPGNHEARINKETGLSLVYSAAESAGIADKFRPHFAFLDVGVGSGGHGKGKQIHYIGYVAHKMRDAKNYTSADRVEGVDFVVFGHDHEPHSHPRARLTYDAKNKAICKRSVKHIDSGAFLNFGGYGADAGYPAQASDIYTLTLMGSRKHMVLHEFII